MRKFIEFEVREFMDVYPKSLFRAMEESETQKFVDDLKKDYSGGSARLARVLTKEEAAQHCLKEIEDVIKRPSVVSEYGYLDHIDVAFIKSLIEEFHKCYK